MRVRWACSGGHGAVPAWAGCLMILGLYPASSQAEPTTGRANTPDLIADASLAYRQRAGATELLWFARADNLGDVLAYSATSVLTQTAPGRAPLPGRSLKVGCRWRFKRVDPSRLWSPSLRTQ